MNAQPSARLRETWVDVIVSYVKVLRITHTYVAIVFFYESIHYKLSVEFQNLRLNIVNSKFK